MNQGEVSPSIFSSKDFLDTLNSITWFLADACWMLEWNVLALGIMIVPIVSGILLLYIDRRPAVFCINGAINSWIWMNTFWIVSEFPNSESFRNYSKISFAIGLVFIGIAILISKNMRDTFSHFRRFRLTNWIKSSF